MQELNHARTPITTWKVLKRLAEEKVISTDKRIEKHLPNHILIFRSSQLVKSRNVKREVLG